MFSSAAAAHLDQAATRGGAFVGLYVRVCPRVCLYVLKVVICTVERYWIVLGFVFKL